MDGLPSQCVHGVLGRQRDRLPEQRSHYVVSTIRTLYESIALT